MLIYSCSRCSLRQDVDSVPDDKRIIHWLCYTFKPFGETLTERQIYLCIDCWREVRREIEDMRKYYEDMSSKAILEQNEGIPDHDCKTSPDSGCSVCPSTDDGYEPDVA